MKRSSLLVATMCLAFAASAMGQSAADLETARDLFKQANDLHDRGDLQGALAKYKAAHELANTPVTGIELGKAYVELKMLTEAREVLLEIDKIPVKPHESEKTTRARQDAAQLADGLHARIPSLTVVIDNLPPNATPSLTIDGTALPPAALGAMRKVNPGNHTVVASIEGGAQNTSTVTLGEGEARTLHLSVQVPTAAPTTPPPETTPPPPVTAPPPPRQPTYVSPVQETTPVAVAPTSGGGGGATAAAWIFVGVGLATWVATAITGGLALSKKSDIESHCDPSTKQCDPTGLDAASSGGTLATVSTVTAIVGGVFIATGIVIAIAAPKGSAAKAALVVAPQLGGGTLGLHVRY